MLRRRAFTLVELLVALVLVATALLGALGVLHRAARREREALGARAARADSLAAHERAAAARARGGVALVELLVVLVLAAVIGAVALGTVGGGAARSRHAGDAARRGARQRAEVADLLARELREGWGAVAIGDTALALERPIGSALACEAGAVPATGDGADWRAVPRAGDVWRRWTGDAWQVVRGGAVRGARCADGRAAWVADGVPAAPPWAFVLVTRSARWVAYRDADAAWHLGLREAHATGWDAVQPAIGPFARLRLAWAPADTGGTLVVHDARGASAVAVVRRVHPRNTP